MNIDAYAVVRQFENVVAEYAGSRFAVAVDSCTAALQLCCELCNVTKVTIPKHTYVSVPLSIIHAGGEVVFEDLEWSGTYRLKPYQIVDSALRFTEGMYEPNTLQCLSFHTKKILPIGRGGMVLTDDAEAASWLRRMRYDGRGEMPLNEDSIELAGWCYFMEPERAARGLTLMSVLSEFNADQPVRYPDISKFPVFNHARGATIITFPERYCEGIGQEMNQVEMKTCPHCGAAYGSLNEK